MTTSRVFLYGSAALLALLLAHVAIPGFAHPFDVVLSALRAAGGGQ